MTSKKSRVSLYKSSSKHEEPPPMSSEALVLTLKIESVVNSFVENISEEYFSEEVPDILFHYTDSKGLLGIIFEKNLWMTDFYHMNDPSEGAISKILGEEDMFGEADDLHSNVSHMLSNSVRNLAIGQFAEPNFENHGALYGAAHRLIRSENAEYRFLSCFSQESDSLGQWREYGGRGKGFSIGFDVSFLIRGRDDVKVIKVIYDKEKQKSIILRFASLVSDFYKENERTFLEDDDRVFLNKVLEVAVFKFLNFIRLHFKKTEYSFEKEWRVVQVSYVGDAEPKWRVVDDVICPYIEFKIDLNEPEIIKKIVFGPRCDVKRNYRSICALLESRYSFRSREVPMSRSATSMR